MEHLRHFTIKVGDKSVADAFYQELQKTASRESILKIIFIESSFCLGKKVVLDITTDDTKFLNNTRGDIEKWFSNALRLRRELIYEIEEIADILYSKPEFQKGI